jgi:hypothetical protein
MYVDLGAEQLLAAEKSGQKIAVEVKSFIGPSELDDLEKALGQYVLYHDVLAEREPDRALYLAITAETLKDVFDEPLGKLVLEKHHLRLIVFDPTQEVIVQWIP